MDESLLRAWLTLLRTPGLGPGAVRERLEACGGDVRRVLEDLRRGPLPPPARAWLAAPEERRLGEDLAWLARPGHRLLCCTEADFPPQLLAIAQPPLALFVAGDAGLLLRPQVAVVGARQASPAGLAHARRFAAALAQAGYVVTSGLAEGIDGAAHRAALDAGAPTVAVIGTGPDRVYPRHHHELAARIVAAGALVSEFVPGTPARPDHFPRRNRLLAGLSCGTLVIEAGLKSGSLITARLAAEAGREVCALPGPIDHALAHGCHRLIRDGARLVETPAEVAEALLPAARAQGGLLAGRLAADAEATPAAAPPPAPEHAALLAALGHAPVALDELIARTGMGASALSAQLLLLELEGRVAPLPGDRYQRIPD